MKYVDPEMEIVEFDKSEVFTVTTSGQPTDTTNEDTINGGSSGVGWD